MVAFLSSVFARIAEKDRVAGLAGSFFDPSDNLGVERICNVRNDDANDICAPCLETAGDLIRMIVEGGHGRFNPNLSFGTDVRARIDDRRNGRNGDASQPGDVAHRVFCASFHTEMLPNDSTRYRNVSTISRHMLLCEPTRIS